MDDDGLSVGDVYRDIIEPAQQEIGHRWQRNEISVAQEHLATAISQLVVANIYTRVPRSSANHKFVLVACVPGELHELGARIASDFLEMAGFSVHFLGADVPADSLAAMALARRPDLVVLSVVTPRAAAGLRDAVAQLRAAAGGTLPILVGGLAAEDVPDLPDGGVTYVGGDARALTARARVLLGV